MFVMVMRTGDPQIHVHEIPVVCIEEYGGVDNYVAEKLGYKGYQGSKISCQISEEKPEIVYHED